MSDSEDEAEMRQRNKRAAFQKQTRLLLADERVKAIADDEKKKAFFNTLADWADEGEYDFLDLPAENELAESQSQDDVPAVDGMDEVIPDSQAADTAAMPAPINPLKRKSPPITPSH
jgi:mediator of replication checkpoint protein 1